MRKRLRPRLERLVITFSSINSNGVGSALVAVSGTESGFGAFNSSSSASVNLATTGANSLVVTSTAVNSGVNPAAQPPLTTLYSSPVGSHTCEKKSQAAGCKFHRSAGEPGLVGVMNYEVLADCPFNSSKNLPKDRMKPTCSLLRLLAIADSPFLTVSNGQARSGSRQKAVS